MRRSLPLLVALLVLAPVFGRAQAPADKPQRYARLLARECDALIDAAIKRPYGWAWSEADPAEHAKPAQRREPIPVSIGPSTSPAGGLILLHAAELLHEPRYTDAARNVGLGLAATQQQRGNFPATGSFGLTSATTLAPASPLPDRAPTRAALGLLLSLVDADPNTQDAATRAAPRAAQWLLRQQAESAAWPILYPPGAPPQDATRLVRLDTPDTRDSVFAMLLAYEVLGEPPLRRAAERSIDFLVKFRAPATADIGVGLWQSAYVPSGIPVEKVREFPPGVDALAARYTVQTLFTTWVILGDNNRLAAAEQATKSLDELIKGNDGTWRRRFSPRSATTAPTTAPTPAPGSVLQAPAKDAAAPEGDPGWAPVTRAVALGRAIGREQYRDRLAETFSLKRRLAVTLAGLDDAPMQLDFPTNPEEAVAYLKDRAPRFRQIEGSRPPELAARIQQLWSLYLRAYIEQNFGI
jgi:hypothetical protein